MFVHAISVYFYILIRVLQFGVCAIGGKMQQVAVSVSFASVQTMALFRE
jgi:hypothetical protein